MSNGTMQNYFATVNMSYLYNKKFKKKMTILNIW